MNSIKPYNVKIIYLFFEYLKNTHSWDNNKIEYVLDKINLDMSQLNKNDIWFDQKTSDKFNNIIVEMTNDPDIAYKVGKFSIEQNNNTWAFSIMKGAISIKLMLANIGNISKFFSKATEFKTLKINRNHCTISVNLLDGFEEKLYQCRNREGMLNAIPKLFDATNVHVEHNSCIHNGDSNCIYDVTWRNSNKDYVFKKAFLLFVLSSVILTYFISYSESLFYALLLSLCFALILRELNYRWLISTSKEQNLNLTNTIELVSRRREEINTIQKIAEIINETKNIEQMYSNITETICNYMSYSRCGFFLIDEKNNCLINVSSTGFNTEERTLIESMNFKIRSDNDTGFLVAVVNSKEKLFIPNVKNKIHTLSKRSQRIVEMLDISSIIVTPLLYKNRILGLITIENKDNNKQLDLDDVELLQRISDIVTITMINTEQKLNLITSLKKLEISEKKNTALRKIQSYFMPLQLDGNETFTSLRKNSHSTSVKNVMFIDLVGYTTFVESLDDESIALDMMNLFSDVSHEIIIKYKGNVNKLIGDGLLVYFEGSGESAVNAAVELLHEINRFHKRFIDEFNYDLAIRIGIYKGLCTIGCIGSKNFLDYSILSDIVNTSARIEQYGKNIGKNIVCVPKELAIFLPEGNKNNLIGEVKLKGKSKKIEIFAYCLNYNKEG